MKTFVATGVLCDYTCGMFVVCAESKEEAIKIIKESDMGYKSELIDELEELVPGDYKYVYGGG